MSRRPRLIRVKERIDLRLCVPGDIVYLDRDVVMLVDSPTTFRMALSSWQVIVPPHVSDPMAHFASLITDTLDHPLLLLLSPLYHRAYLSARFGAIDPRLVEYIGIRPHNDEPTIFWNRTQSRVTGLAFFSLVAAERDPRTAMTKLISQQIGYARRVLMAICATDAQVDAIGTWCEIRESRTVFVGKLDGRFAAALSQTPLAIRRLTRGKHAVRLLWCSVAYPHATLPRIRAMLSDVRVLDVRMAYYGSGYMSSVYGSRSYCHIESWEWLHARKLTLDLFLALHSVVTPAAFVELVGWTCDLAFSPRALVLELATQLRASIRRIKTHVC